MAQPLLSDQTPQKKDIQVLLSDVFLLSSVWSESYITNIWGHLTPLADQQLQGELGKKSKPR